MRRLSKLLAVVMPLLLMLGLIQTAAAVDPAPPYFSATWARTDMPVQQGQAVRTWNWGPDADTTVLWEQYEQSPEGHRQVQYFDKSRMEITDPSADPNSIWYVTNGLLVVELVTGQMQVGDNQFVPMTPSQANVAGDQGGPNGPSYATFESLMGPVNDGTGAINIQTLDRDGNVGSDSSLSSYNVLNAEYNTTTEHNIAAPFWNFMNSSGIIYENGQYVEGLLYPNPYYGTGFPISEAYWSHVLVGGVDTLVLMQCFQRRCMTYTPSNAEAWQVEAGNVGQSYYSWRYTNPPATAAIAFELHYSNGNSDLYSINSDGSDQMMLTDDSSDQDLLPSWSPDGSQIAFWANKSGAPGLWVMNADGSSTTEIATDATDNASLDWAPSGSLIAYACNTANLCTTGPDGSGNAQITNFPTDSTGMIDNINWSADSSKLAFNYKSSSSATNDVYVIDANGSNQVQITNNPDHEDVHPTWAPDGSMIAFSADTLSDGRYAIWTAHPDGTALNELTNGGDFGGSDQAPVWSTAGNTIAFVRFRSNGTDVVGNILKINSDGTGFAELTTNMNDTDEGPSWSPNGSHLAFWANPNGVPNIFVMDSSGNNIQQITNFTSETGSAMNPVWGP